MLFMLFIWNESDTVMILQSGKANWIGNYVLHHMVNWHHYIQSTLYLENSKWSKKLNDSNLKNV